MDEIIRNIVAQQLGLYADVVAEKVYEKIEAANMTPKGIGKKQAANQLGISLPTLDRLIRSGRLRAMHAGRKVLIAESEIKSLLAGDEPYKYQRRSTR